MVFYVHAALYNKIVTVLLLPDLPGLLFQSAARKDNADLFRVEQC